MTRPREQHTNPRALHTNPRATATNPRAQAHHHERNLPTDLVPLWRHEFRRWVRICGGHWSERGEIHHDEQPQPKQPPPNGPRHCGHCGNDWAQCVCTPKDFE